MNDMAFPAPMLTRSPGRLETMRLLRKSLSNPMDFWPPEIYQAPIVKVNFMGAARYFVSDPAMIQTVMLDNADRLHKSDQMRRALEPALGQGILTAEDDRWRAQRRVVAPVFRPSAVNSFIPAMIAQSRTMLARWQSLPEGVPVEVDREMMHLTFEIILETMLSGRGDINVAEVERSIADFLKATPWVAVLTMLGLPEWTPFPGKLRAAKGRGYLRGMIMRRVVERRESGLRLDDLLSLLLDARDPETNTGFSDVNIVDNILTFIGAGHETTALALTWTFYLLSHHPEIEAKILAEIAAVTNGAPLEAEQVADLVYLRQVIMESMRLYSPVSIVGREVMESFELGGATINAGDRVLVAIHAVHHNPNNWSDPERFDPDRFAPEQMKTRHRFAWLPFGAGPRICIGMQFALLEAAAILGTLLPAMRLTAKPGYVPVPISRVTTRPDRGMPMTMARRA